MLNNVTALERNEMLYVHVMATNSTAGMEGGNGDQESTVSYFFISVSIVLLTIMLAIIGCWRCFMNGSTLGREARGDYDSTSITPPPSFRHSQLDVIVTTNPNLMAVRSLRADTLASISEVAATNGDYFACGVPSDSPPSYHEDAQEP